MKNEEKDKEKEGPQVLLPIAGIASFCNLITAFSDSGPRLKSHELTGSQLRFLKMEYFQKTVPVLQGICYTSLNCIKSFFF